MTESIALCAIVKDEVRSIIEWLAHYKALGVDEFLIYDNESRDGTEVILQALDDAGEIIYVDWPHAVGVRPQRRAYEHARKHAASDWVAYFDADEFLVLREDATIGDFLRRFPPDVAAVAVNWVIFGSDGQACYRPGPVTERFGDALPEGAFWNRAIKSFGRRTQLTGTGVHRVDPGRGRYVTPSGAEAAFDGPMRTKTADTGIATLHHYIIKSLEEFEEKLGRGNTNAQHSGGRRMRLERRFPALNAGGVRNADIRPWTGPMRLQAVRLRDLLLAQGISYPVWPFVEERG
jgi:glycosyltransferase involved in cell wall biosynthesis